MNVETLIVVVFLAIGAVCGIMLGVFRKPSIDMPTEHPATILVIYGIVGSFLAIPLGVLSALLL